MAKRNYRYDLLQARRKETGDSYGVIAKRARLSKNAVVNVIKGETDPTASTIRAVCRAMDLDPKYAFDFNLVKDEFHCAVLATTVR